MNGRNEGTGKQKGYMTSYTQSLERIEEAKERECAAMGSKWSERREKKKSRRCPRCGKTAAVKRYCVPRTIQTKVGVVTYERHYHYCESCKEGFFPRDEELGINGEDMTDDVVGLAMDFAANEVFGQAVERLKLHHGIQISETKLTDLFERQSEAVEKQEYEDGGLRKTNRHQAAVVMVDGSMVRMTTGWREVKLLSVGVIDAPERSFVTATEGWENLAEKVRRCPWLKEVEHREMAWIADGSGVNWSLQEELCPTAHGLLDYWHAMEHVWEGAKGLLGEKEVLTQLYADTVGSLLLEGKIEELLTELRECVLLAETESARGAVNDLLRYLDNQRDRLRYAEFRQRGWPIGSGQIESAHRWVIQKRMKLAGIRWSPTNAGRMANVRARYASRGPKGFYDLVLAAAA